MNKFICLAILVMFAGAATLSAGPNGTHKKDGKTTDDKTKTPKKKKHKK